MLVVCLFYFIIIFFFFLNWLAREQVPSSKNRKSNDVHFRLEASRNIFEFLSFPFYLQVFKIHVHWRNVFWYRARQLKSFIELRTQFFSNIIQNPPPPEIVSAIVLHSNAVVRRKAIYYSRGTTTVKQMKSPSNDTAALQAASMVNSILYLARLWLFWNR